MYSIRLRARGWRVTRAANGGEALRLATAERPDLVLLDLRLAVIDGLRVLKGLLADEFTRRIPVIVFSNTSRDSEEAREALRLGAIAYLVKAETDPAELSRTLEELVPV